MGDFVLQEKSPYHEPGQIRMQMGASYGGAGPNFSKVISTLIIMISDKQMMAKYPLDEND